jgi:hypothetical protein
MNKLEEICQKFLLLKKKLDKEDYNFLCNHSFKSLKCGFKGLYKENHLQTNISTKNNSNEKEIKTKPKKIDSNSKNNNNKECLKNLLFSLEMTKTKSKSDKNSNKIQKIEKNNDKDKSTSPNINDMSNSPSIVNDEENHINNTKEEDNKSNKVNSNLISLNEEDDELTNKNNSDKKNKNLKSKLDSKIQKKNGNNNNFYINLIDKDNKDFNLREKILDNFSNYSKILSKLTEILPKINEVEKFFNQNKEKMISNELKNINIVYIKSLKKFIHLYFNTLSKIFNSLSKGTENDCIFCLNVVLELITLIINFIKLIKKFIKNNNENVDITFLKDIKSIGKYCMYVLILKKNDYEYMIEVENKKDNKKVNEFFNNYLNYFKSVHKLQKIFKENITLIKHFMIQPSMVSFIDLVEMNKKIINYQLNINFI